MNRSLIIINLFLVWFLAGPLRAEDVRLKTRLTRLTIDSNGFFSSVNVAGKEILHQGKYPLIIGCAENKLIMPGAVRTEKDLLRIAMADGKTVVLRYHESNTCITLEVADVPGSYDAVLLAPVKVSINDVVGDVIGVAQGDGIAFGIQSLNIKTTAGIPQEYARLVLDQYSSNAKQAELSVGSISADKLAAAKFADGTTFQFSCRRRDKTEYRKVNQLEGSMALPVEGGDASIKGAKIALFGSADQDALVRIGEIEIEQGLPHPLFDGIWGKTSRASMKSYLISNFGEDDLDFVLEKAKLAGFDYIYHTEPFRDWGHFNWDTAFVKGGDAGVKKLVDKANSQGVKVGVHILSNFMTTNDAFVSPVPSDHLLKQGILKLQEDLDPQQTEIKVSKSGLFSVPLTLNALQIGKELITFAKAEENGGLITLTNCTRGAFGTTASAHAASEPFYKLWDYPYKTLFPDLKLQDQFSDRLIEIFNTTGLEQISFDGLEGCMYTGQDDYATARFVFRFYQGIHHNVLNDASRLSHYLWHIHTRMNWGEPWGEAMRTGQVESRIKNQDFFKRNLFPRMLGWFLIRLADKNFECSTLEDLEWALSESAGFDAGYAMTINMNTLKKHGQIDLLLEAIKNWDALREVKAFSEEQMEKLKDPLTEWHLEKVDDQNFLLYPLTISKYFRCNLGEMQPGQPGGSDWSWNSPEEGRFSIRLRVEGEGSVKNPAFTTSKGVIKFPCTISGGQYLFYGFDGKAMITDKNYNTLEVIEPLGKAVLPAGSSAVSFSCDAPDDETPEVNVRYMTRSKPEQIKKQN